MGLFTKSSYFHPNRNRHINTLHTVDYQNAIDSQRLAKEHAMALQKQSIIAKLEAQYQSERNALQKELLEQCDQESNPFYEQVARLETNLRNLLDQAWHKGSKTRVKLSKDRQNLKLSFSKYSIQWTSAYQQTCDQIKYEVAQENSTSTATMLHQRYGDYQSGAAAHILSAFRYYLKTSLNLRMSVIMPGSSPGLSITFKEGK